MLSFKLSPANSQYLPYLYYRSQKGLITLFDLIIYVPVNNFQLCQDGSSWVEPVLSKDKCVLLKDTTQ